jgi:hypothetical protein
MPMSIAELLISCLQFVVLVGTEVDPGRFEGAALIRNDGAIIDP